MISLAFFWYFSSVFFYLTDFSKQNIIFCQSLLIMHTKLCTYLDKNKRGFQQHLCSSTWIISNTSDLIVRGEQQRNDNNSNIVAAIVCRPTTPTVFVKRVGMRVTGLWFWKSINQSVGLQWDISFEAFVYFGFIGPRMPPIHLWPTQHFLY